MKYAVRFFMTFESENSSLSEAEHFAAIEHFAVDAANAAHDSLETLSGVKLESIETFYAAFPEGSAVFAAIQKAIVAQCGAVGVAHSLTSPCERRQK